MERSTLTREAGRGPNEHPAGELAHVLVALSDLGPPSEIRGRAPELAARYAGLDRVLLTSVHAGELVAEALHVTGEADSSASLLALQDRAVALEYPLVEGELLRRRRGAVLHVPADGFAANAYADLLGWTEYVAVPIIIDTRVIGFLHGDRLTGQLGDEVVAALTGYAIAFAIVFERATLRIRLRRQQQELRQIAAWAAARTGELGDRPVGLEAVDGEDELPSATDGSPAYHDELRALLTRRELEVLELMVRGETNPMIARELVLSAGTVKFHVKNILRKLHAANRAEATSRYLRLTLNRANGGMTQGQQRRV